MGAVVARPAQQACKSLWGQATANKAHTPTYVQIIKGKVHPRQSPLFRSLSPPPSSRCLFLSRTPYLGRVYSETSRVKKKRNQQCGKEKTIGRRHPAFHRQT